MRADAMRRPEPLHRRTLQNVRRNSKLARDKWWGDLPHAQGSRIKHHVRIYHLSLRKKGQRQGAAGTMSWGAVRLCELLVDIAVKGRGKLEPSAGWLAKALNTPIKNIHAWKAQLKRHGFLDWQRRFVETGRDGIRGPQVHQTSNAYWLALPSAAVAYVRQRLGPRASAGDRADHVRRMDPGLAASLDRLEAGVTDRADRRRSRPSPT